jgi:hypothetical protein
MSQRKQTKPAIEEIARQALAWFETEAGRQSVDQADQQVEETAKLLDRGYDINPTKLYDPFTV